MHKCIISKELHSLLLRRNIYFPSSRGRNSDRGDPVMPSYKHGLPRLLRRLAMTGGRRVRVAITKQKSTRLAIMI